MDLYISRNQSSNLEKNLSIYAHFEQCETFI